MPVPLNGDALHIHLGRRRVLMIQRLLRLDKTPRLLGHYTGVGVPRLVEVDVSEPGLPGVSLQVLDEGARRERRAGTSRSVVARPQGALRFDDVHPARRLKIV